MLNMSKEDKERINKESYEEYMAYKKQEEEFEQAMMQFLLNKWGENINE